MFIFLCDVYYKQLTPNNVYVKQERFYNLFKYKFLSHRPIGNKRGYEKHETLFQFVLIQSFIPYRKQKRL